MKKYLLLTALFFSSVIAKETAAKKTASIQPSKKAHHKTVDQVAAVIYTDTDPIVLTKSDFNRLSINGAKQNKKDIILAHMLDYEATHVYKIPVPDDAVKKYITSIKEANQIDDARLKNMFKSVGYSYDQGIDELRRMLSIDSLLNFKIKSRLVVPEQDVREYYNKNPQEVPASFRIKKGFLSKNALSDDELKEFKTDGKHAEMVNWLTPYWLQEDEMAESLKVLINMKEGSMTELKEVGDGYEVIKLLKKEPAKTRTFEECYKEIADKLRAPLFEKLLKDYQDELLKKYEVVYL